jgi:DNA-binding beta-propeller fold protein YncE
MRTGERRHLQLTARLVALALAFGSIGVATTRAEEVPATPVTAALAVAWTTQGGPDLPFDDPFQLAVDPEGNLWVADGNNHRFQIFAPDGTFLEAWGTEGDGEGEFDFVDFAWDQTGAVAFGDDAIYVLDPGNDRVQKFTAEREFVLAWGDEGHDDGEFQHPYDIAVDGQGRVYVIDDVRDDVQVFDGDGNFLFAFAGHGRDPGQLSDTGGMALAPDGTVWIADWGMSRVQTFSPDGRHLTVLGGPGLSDGRFAGPIDVAVDGEGRAYVSDVSRYDVQVFDRDGHYLMTLGEYGLGEDQFAQPGGIAIAADGTIYVSDGGLDRVTAFQPVPAIGMPVPATPAP